MSQKISFLLLIEGIALFFLFSFLACRSKCDLLNKKMVIPVYFQEAPNTCGPAALLSICKFYGIDTTEEEIALLAGTNQTGTSMYGLAQAAEKLGLKAAGIELSLSELKSARKPLIAHINEGHFVVVISFHEEQLTLIEPVLGVKSVSQVDFRRGWKGYVLLLEPRNK